MKPNTPNVMNNTRKQIDLSNKVYLDLQAR